MANREDVLRDETYKDQTDDLEHRVFYTLNNKKGMELHRVTKAITLVIVRLREQGILDDDSLDDLLLECVR